MGTIYLFARRMPLLLKVIVVFFVVVIWTDHHSEAFTFSSGTKDVPPRRRPPAARHLPPLRQQQTALSSSNTRIADTGVSKYSQVNRKLLSESDSPPFPRTWVPLASVYELDPKRPNSVSFLDKEFIIYGTADDDEDCTNWIVTGAVCPHRLAPLAEGRITTSINKQTVLECAYHGWSFDNNGKCVRIPQATFELEQKAMAACRIPTYTTVVEKNIVWIWPWTDDQDSVLTGVKPEQFLCNVLPDCSTYTRDLPYSWDTLVENIVDPSHVPFAHHGLQGTRDDATPITMSLPNEITETGFNMDFADRTMQLQRKGQVEFRAPFVIQYDAEFERPKSNDNDDNDDGSSSQPPRAFNLTAICIPTRPGWSRIILFGAPLSKDEKKLDTITSKIFRGLPVWLIHAFSNRFLDSDLAFLHYQDYQRNATSRTYGYYMPAPSDRSVVAMRNWIDEFAHVPGPLLDRIYDRPTLFDRYAQHSDHCRHCSAALKSLEMYWRNGTYAILAFSILFINQVWVASFSVVVCLLLLRLYDYIEDTIRKGEFRHYEND